MWTIFRLTFKELLSKKILLVSIILTMVYLTLYGIGLHFVNVKGMADTSEQIYRLMAYSQLLSMGLYFASFIVCLFAVFSGVGAISSEVDSGIMLSIVAKPIRRGEIVVGKFLGYAVMLLLYSAFIYFSIFIMADKMLGLKLGGQVTGYLLFALQPIILLGIAILGSTFLSTVANGVGVFILYMVGMIGGMIEQIGYAIEKIAAVNVGVVASLLMPVDTIFRHMTNIIFSQTPSLSILNVVGPFVSQKQPSGWMILYIFIYLIMCLVLSIKIFKAKEI